MKKLILLILSSALISISCQDYSQDEYEEHFVVESYLYANRSLPQVRISNTVPAHEYYDYSEKSTVSSANVRIHLLEKDSEEVAESVFDYEYRDGNYFPLQKHIVIPNRSYKLNIHIPGKNESISAITTIPGEFEIMNVSQDTIIYKSEKQLELQISTSHFPERQSIFVFNTMAESGIEENLTELYKEIWKGKDHDPHYFRRLSSHSWGLLNEDNFPKNNDENLSVIFPWSEFPFFGENLIIANTIDDNLYDFLRSQTVQRDDSGIPPGEMQNVITNIDGALGIFGSVAADSIKIYLKRPK